MFRSLSPWRARADERPLTSVSLTLFGCVYASGMLAFLIAIRHGSGAVARPTAAVLLTLFPLIITWICDTAAMAVGSAVGDPNSPRAVAEQNVFRGDWRDARGVIAALASGNSCSTARAGASATHNCFCSASPCRSWDRSRRRGIAVQAEAGLKDSSTLIPDMVAFWTGSILFTS